MNRRTLDNTFEAQVLQVHPRNAARVLRLRTPHGEVLTPCFMPVGTHATVSAMTPEALERAGVQMILGGNTYHMICSPGLPRIQALGGMHRFMGWHGPMLTDSGGYQVFSLARDGSRCRIDDDGASFREPVSGRPIRLTPASSIEAQKIIGADIIMVFDQCTPDTSDRPLVEAALRRTHAWLALSKAAHVASPNSAYGLRQALFGIIQGGPYLDLRVQSAEQVIAHDLDGIAIGGESVGYNMPRTLEILNHLVPLFPAQKPRYTMGVGLGPQDLIDVVAAGADMFDCVAPTRNARHGALYCGAVAAHDGWLRWESEEPNGRINLNNSRFAEDDRPVMPDCTCTTCRQHSRAYLRFLLKSNAITYYALATAHNVHVTQEVCRAMRQCIAGAEGLAEAGAGRVA